MDEFERLLHALSPDEREVVVELWSHRERYIRWPQKRTWFPVDLELLRMVRRFINHPDEETWMTLPTSPSEGGIHVLPEVSEIVPGEIVALADAAGIPVDLRGQGFAVLSYLLSGGERPLRASGREWRVRHVYDGRHPWPGREHTTRAMRHPEMCADSGGLVAVHPVIDSALDEYPWLAWQLRLVAYDRFDLDPDDVLAKYVSKSKGQNRQPDLARAFVPWVHALGERSVSEFGPRPVAVQALAWRIAARMITRHPGDIRVVEWHPADGQYDCLSLFRRSRESDKWNGWAEVVHMNMLTGYSRLTNQAWFSADPADENDTRFTWLDVALADDFVRNVVAPIEWVEHLPPGAEQQIGPHSLGANVIAAFLARHALEGKAWTVLCGFGDQWGGEREHLFAPFPGAEEYRRAHGRNDPFGLASTRFWFLAPTEDMSSEGSPRPIAAIDVVSGIAWRDGAAIAMADIAASDDGGVARVVERVFEGYI